MASKKEIHVCKHGSVCNDSDRIQRNCDCNNARTNNSSANSIRDRIRRGIDAYIRRGRGGQKAEQRKILTEPVQLIRRKTVKINETQIRNIMPQCSYPETWVRPLNDAMDRFNISENVLRVSTFLAQIAHESGQMNRLQENLNYSRQRLRAVWPSRFPDDESTFTYGRNPERLANKVYANRLGNGAEQTGDGFRYRGRGLLQITGRDNYAKMGRLLDLPTLIEMPDYLIEPRWAALSAAAFWADADLNALADTLTEDDIKVVVRRITKLINGGDHGLKERLSYTNNALEVLDTEFTV